MILNPTITGGVAGLDKVTAAPEAVRSGVTFIDSNGELKAGNMPDAGRPYVESCTFNSATKQVKVRARTPQAGEVKTPEGEEQEFPIQVPPSVDGAFYYLSIVNLSGQTATIKLFHTNQEVTLKQKENKIITCDITSKEPFSAFLNLPIYRSGVRVSTISTGIRDGRLCIGVNIVIYTVNGVPDSSDPTE